ncbi:hypothetical protein [Streptomyces sp. NBC_01012]|uniref:hypothetical protein n=1 Tax=Streptomyces sp. NBC_01012 TaxID=2903717 RepID=UPI00386D2598|nr:hypothetical protein OG623_22415 [Streptomyces sp. NBC_01012]
MKHSDRILRGLRTGTGLASAEYLGVLGVVGLVVTALLATGIGGDIATHTSQQICRVVKMGEGSDGSECLDDNDADSDSDSSDPDKSDPSGDDDTETTSASDEDSGDDSDDGSDDSEDTSDTHEGNALPSLCFEPRERVSSVDGQSQLLTNDGLDQLGRGEAAGIGAVAAINWGFDYLVDFIATKISNEKNKEKRVKAALDDLAYCLPDYNIVIAQPHEGNLQQMDGAAMIETIEISGTTYRVYAFKSGKFTWSDKADLGWKNRAFHGYYDISDDKRTVTFDEPPRPKRKKDWKPGDEGCQIEGEELPDRDRYYNTYSPLDSDGSTTAVRMLVNDLRRCYPDYNVVAMHSEQKSHWVDKPDTMVHEGRYRLNSNEYYEDEEGDDIESGRAVFDVYVFDKGTFKNDGDGGFINWALYGDLTRDGMEASFEKPDPADLDADSIFNGTESVNFNDGSPKYTDGTYPGTDFSGKKPKDKAELTHSLLDEYSKAFPGKNIITAKSFNDLSFAGVSGLEHLAEVDGVDIFSIEDGTIANNGDGGWKNWGFTGHYNYDEDGKKVTFSSK